MDTPGFERLCTTVPIYAFHMPVFVFISGYFTNVHSNNKKLFRWIFSTLIIYIVVQEIQNILWFALGEGYDLEKITLITPFYTLWYLVSLITWRILLVFFHDKIGDKSLVLISFSICALSGLVPVGNPFSVQRTLVFLPFFVLGYVCRKNALLQKIDKTPYYLSILLFFIGIVLSKYIPMYMPTQPYQNLHSVIVRFAQTFNALLITYAILRLSNIAIIKKVAKYGKYTLWIYLGHTIITSSIHHHLFKVYKIPISLPFAIILSFIYCVICIMAHDIYKKISSKNKSYHS